MAPPVEETATEDAVVVVDHLGQPRVTVVRRRGPLLRVLTHRRSYVRLVVVVVVPLLLLLLLTLASSDDGFGALRRREGSAISSSTVKDEKSERISAS